MSFRVKYRGLEVVCETIQDIDALADNLERKPERVHTPVKPTEQRVAVRQAESNGHSSEATGIAAFVSRLQERQKSVLRILAEMPQGYNDTELREKVGVKDNMSLAGITSVMSKTAKASGLNYDSIVEKTVLSAKPGQRAYHYRIANSVREELQKALD